MLSCFQSGLMLGRKPAASIVEVGWKLTPAIISSGNIESSLLLITLSSETGLTVKRQENRRGNTRFKNNLGLPAIACS